MVATKFTDGSEVGLAARLLPELFRIENEIHDASLRMKYGACTPGEAGALVRIAHRLRAVRHVLSRELP